MKQERGSREFTSSARSMQQRVNWKWGETLNSQNLPPVTYFQQGPLLITSALPTEDLVFKSLSQEGPLSCKPPQFFSGSNKKATDIMSSWETRDPGKCFAPLKYSGMITPQPLSNEEICAFLPRRWWIKIKPRSLR